MADIEIGLGKSGRRAYGFDDVAIVPSRRTRDRDDVDISWQVDAVRLEVPILVSPMDGVVSPSTAGLIGDLGAAGVLHLEGVWTRHEDPQPALDSLMAIDDPVVAMSRLRDLYEPPVRPELVTARIRELHERGVTTAVAVTPQRAQSLQAEILKGEPDLLIIQGTVVSAEHVSRTTEPLNLKQFVRELEVPVIVGGCASYQAALHLMRTGAAGVLVGVGAGRASSTRRVLGVGIPSATVIADARAARMRHLDETGVYVHVIADGGMATGGDVAKAVVCGADAVMMGSPLAASVEAPAGGWFWGMPAIHSDLPRGTLSRMATTAPLAQILCGPATDDSGSTNLVGALRKSMSLCGYASLKEFQKADITVGGLS